MENYESAFSQISERQDTPVRRVSPTAGSGTLNQDEIDQLLTAINPKLKTMKRKPKTRFTRHQSNAISCKENKIILIHYTFCGTFELDLNRVYSQPVKMQDFVIAKPNGLWVSMEDAGGWEKWCIDNDFHPEKLKKQFKIELKESTNILSINNDNDFNEFERRYRITANNEKESGFQPIKWSMVIKDYQGIIITKYFEERRLSSMWYNGWDCVGGCIWDLRAVKEIRIINDKL
ncbi:hypothetical protein LQZ19_15300 [Treponema primitia]|uniref:hypothetical protein n=1 Tax=Treponema primitia TaxID=88058 RepID=UPI00397ED678